MNPWHVNRNSATIAALPVLGLSKYRVLPAGSQAISEGIAEAKRAVELEPLSAELNTLLGIVYFYAKRYELASEQLRKTIELEPNFWWAHTYLARTYEQSGKLPAAITELERARLMEGATIEAGRRWAMHMQLRERGTRR